MRRFLALSLILALAAPLRGTFLEPKAVSDTELRDLSKQLHLKRRERSRGNRAQLARADELWQHCRQSSSSDVPAGALQGPTISKLVAMLDNYIADVTQTEVITTAERAEDNAFLDAILATSVMQQAHQFLVSKGLADSDVAVFKEYLRQIWLGQYNRGGGIQGSSGYEHVFLGEKNGNSISGYHGWVKYYQDEQAGNVNYLGYITATNLGQSILLEVPMSWDGIYKSLNSLTVSNSPELELAIGTVCFLARPNAVCPVMGGNGTPYGYQTYTQSYNGKTYVGSAYPVAP